MKYYIYGHYREDTRLIFYIGKGSNQRAWSKHNRNKYWKNIVEKHGYYVEILHCFIDEEEAYKKEVELIKSMAPCANLAPGGLGGDTLSKLSYIDRCKFREGAKIRAADPDGGVAKAAELRRGKTKHDDAGLKRMAESHSKTYSGKGNPMFGQTFWAKKDAEQQVEIKKQISETLKETCEKNPRKYKIVECPHCGKIGGQTGLTRYHFNNCKDK